MKRGYGVIMPPISNYVQRETALAWQDELVADRANVARLTRQPV